MTDNKKTVFEDHDCDEGLICCDGCRHTGHMLDAVKLPDGHAATDSLICMAPSPFVQRIDETLLSAIGALNSNANMDRLLESAALELRRLDSLARGAR